MPSVGDVKARIKDERKKVRTGIAAIVGSRVLLAVLMACFVAFSSQLIYSPFQLPTFSGLNLAAVGLPPSLDFGLTGQAARDATDAAVRQGLGVRVRDFLDARPILRPILNGIGFGICIALIAWTLAIQIKERRGGIIR